MTMCSKMIVCIGNGMSSASNSFRLAFGLAVLLLVALMSPQASAATVYTATMGTGWWRGSRMRKLFLWAASVALVAFQVPDANAATVTFNWSYTDGGTTNVGSGTLVATVDPLPDTYDVISISGTANGQAVVGLSGYDGPDQHVFSPSPPDIAVDTLGISFSVGSGLTSFNLYRDDIILPPGSPFFCGGIAVYCLLGPGTVGPGDPVVPIAFSLTPVSATPLPGALPLFAGGLGAMGLLGWRRKRKNTAAIAA